MPRNRSSTWRIRSGRGRSRWPIPGLARRRFTSRHCMPSRGREDGRLLPAAEGERVRIVDGNSVVRDLVARGDVKVGLTDTDDVNVALEDGQPIAMVLPDKDGLGVPVMPNMVSLIANAPHPADARRLIDYLLSPDVERQLAQSEAA